MDIRCRLLPGLVLTALLALPVSPALALCVSRPDDASSHYVENSTAQTLCLQGEVADTAARLQAEGRLKALQAEMAAEMRRQRLLATPVPQVGLPQAAW
jgi:hypothetical protein